MRKIKTEKGITLVALIITIIVLLILAVVAINAVTGDGIIQHASNARTEYEKKAAEENVILKELEQTIKDSISEPKKEYIAKDKSFVGYYADLNGDKEPDGIIYADLATGAKGDGQWTDNNGNYTIPIETNVKEYTKSTNKHKGKFGEAEIISVEKGSTGADRFYVMALSDIDTSTHYWYYNAYGNMSDYATYTSGDFGKGKENTSKMIEKWDKGANGGYGEQNANDMWGLIKNQVSNGWFVPSEGEWSAFAEELGITKENYPEFGLSYYYWSSSQGDTYGAWYADFDFGYMYSRNVDYDDLYVRLSTTF